MGSITPLYVEGDLRLNIRIAYWYDDIGTVDFIFFRAIEELVKTDTNGNWISKQPIIDFPNYYKRVEYYSLSHVLSEQGMPSSVVIKASGAPGGPMIAAGIDIALLYPDQGIWVNYTMPMYNLDGVKKGCPANAHIEMELFPPGNPDFFFTQLDQTDWGVIKNGYIPLEEATSMSVEQFYHKFLNSNDNCIETPAYIWPTPEPRSDWP
jgi:hypothetical protein